jgi:hypothetical protein
VLAVRETSDFWNVPKYRRPHPTSTVFLELFPTVAGLSSTISKVFCMEYSGRGLTSGFLKALRNYYRVGSGKSCRTMTQQKSDKNF